MKKATLSYRQSLGLLSLPSHESKPPKVGWVLLRVDDDGALARARARTTGAEL